MILLALGANIPSRFGTPNQSLNHALALLPERGVRVLQVSRLYSNPAVPASDQPDYVNCVAAVSTTIGPAELIEICLEIERELGRVRSERWEARAIDIDILDFDGQEVVSPQLTLPHPRLGERAFVLIPLLEIAPDWRHPVTGKRGVDLLARIDAVARAAVKPLAPQ
jgi:2-amino-4-hydroxy-6-hydroxymethyldihydropteridine diphosphokinase